MVGYVNKGLSCEDPDTEPEKSSEVEGNTDESDQGEASLADSIRF